MTSLARIESALHSALREKSTNLEPDFKDLLAGIKEMNQTPLEGRSEFVPRIAGIIRTIELGIAANTAQNLCKIGNDMIRNACDLLAHLKDDPQAAPYLSTMATKDYVRKRAGF